MKKLVWKVFINENDVIIAYNVFNNSSFYEHLQEAKKLLYKRRKEKGKLTAKDYDWFKNLIRNGAMFSFWSKYEYEVFVTEPFPSIDKQELLRLNKPDNQGKTNLKIDLNVGLKIDVYTQLSLNWDNFVQYIWQNIRYIRSK